ncbi:Putative FAD binding domain protein [Penicillium brasilianum]|uniref:Putative FAD binding domain protein n=1 Tax=Penicillium brasilianum TaxID=104259 RepID=A0A0F7VBG9_PENBI|nr:Putative FAD binding domain protein [Penicillium brasilianum]
MRSALTFMLRLAAALYLAQLGIPFRIIDKRSDEPRIGQADGLNPKTMEIFESWGIHNQITQLWEPATHETIWYRGLDGELVRTDRYLNQPPMGVRWTHGTLQQGTVEEIMKKKIYEIADMTVGYHTTLCELNIDITQLTAPGAFPCTTQVQQMKKGSIVTEIITAKYVIGADGGKSLTRTLLDIGMNGEKGASVWGVMDFAGSSDFPDFGATSIIRSATDGSLDFVRREEGLIRMYVELNKGPEGKHICRENITPEAIVQKCQYMIRPYRLDVRRWVWWSAFTATQKLSTALSKFNRVFLVGDAVHTHSPVTGMGMNTSIQDSYNLAWKLAGVIKGQLNPKILATYDTERGIVAKQLLQADRTTLELFDTKFGHETPSLLERAETLRVFLAGRAIRYADALLTSPSAQGIGSFQPGECLPDFSITNHATGRSVHIHNALKSNETWNMIVFAGDVSSVTQMTLL